MKPKLIAASNGHFYKIGEECYPSSTTILKRAYPMEAGLKMFLQRTTKEEAENLLTTAGLSGSKVHHAIDLMFQGIEIKSTGFTKDDVDNCGIIEPRLSRYLYKPFNKKEDRCLRGFLNWCEKFKPEVDKTEMIVWDEKNKYAGTLDFVGEIEIKGKPVKVLIDWKTSKGLYKEMDLQVASYWGTFPKKDITPFIVQFGINKCGYRMKEVKDPEENFKQFLNIKKTFDFLNPKYGPRDYEFLDSYKLN